MDLLNKIQQDGLIVIIRNIPTNLIKETVDSLYKGGARVFEVALNSEECYEQIKLLKKVYKNKIIIGAGTVTNKKRAEEAYQAGADFYLTPGLNMDVLNYSLENNIPIIPGVFSPSEVQSCLEMGFKFFKLFPANSLHMNYIKNLKGPYDNFDVIAVGGVTEENIEEFLSAGHVGIGMGGSLVDTKLIFNQRWEIITEKVKRIRKVLDDHKNKNVGGKNEENFNL